jgi:hypothetical protein
VGWLAQLTGRDASSDIKCRGRELVKETRRYGTIDFKRAEQLIDGNLFGATST